jgi:uncharacterized membrane protein
MIIIIVSATVIVYVIAFIPVMPFDLSAFLLLMTAQFS